MKKHIPTAAQLKPVRMAIKPSAWTPKKAKLSPQLMVSSGEVLDWVIGRAAFAPATGGMELGTGFTSTVCINQNTSFNENLKAAHWSTDTRPLSQLILRGMGSFAFSRNLERSPWTRKRETPKSGFSSGRVQ